MATITWYGHASFKLIYGGKTIWLDPWINGNPKWPAGATIGETDIFLITHGHFDHLDADLPKWADETGAIIFSTPAVVHFLADQGVKNLAQGNTGGTVAEDDIRITWTEGRHATTIQTEANAGYAHECTGFLLRHEDEPTLYIAGDTGILPGMELLGKMYEPDIAILPIGDRYTMGPYEAAWATRLLGVSTVIPGHYGTFGMLTGTAEEFVAELEDDEASVVVLGVGNSVHL